MLITKTEQNFLEFYKSLSPAEQAIVREHIENDPEPVLIRVLRSDRSRTGFQDGIAISTTNRKNKITLLVR